jgi:hypothetical protein
VYLAGWLNPGFTFHAGTGPAASRSAPQIRLSATATCSLETRSLSFTWACICSCNTTTIELQIYRLRTMLWRKARALPSRVRADCRRARSAYSYYRPDEQSRPVVVALLAWPNFVVVPGCLLLARGGNSNPSLCIYNCIRK